MRRQPQNYYDFGLGLGSSHISQGCRERSNLIPAAAAGHEAAYESLWKKSERPAARQSGSKVFSGSGTDSRWQATQPNCEISCSLGCIMETGRAARGQRLTQHGTSGIMVVDQRIDGMKGPVVVVATVRANSVASVGGRDLVNRMLKHLVYQVSARRPGQSRRHCRIGRGRTRQESCPHGRAALPRAYMFRGTFCPIIPRYVSYNQKQDKKNSKNWSGKGGVRRGARVAKQAHTRPIERRKGWI